MSDSYMATRDTVQPRWYVIDGDGQIVGRLAVRLATILMGKHKPTYTPHVDCGDYVIVTNVEKVRFSGQPLAHEMHPYFTNKMLTKEYDRFSGHPDGRKVVTAAELWKRRPDEILRLAVKRMLPKNKLGGHMLSKLKLFAGPNHTHQAQQPAELPENLR